jgi:uncharacterized membrane protein YeaQ/YmgE (transglycosylase-associated protein family)
MPQTVKNTIEVAHGHFVVAGRRAHSGFPSSKIVNRSGEGLVRDIILGVIGAVIGDAIFTELGLVGVTGVNLTSIVVAAIGAIIVSWFIMRL